MHYKRLLLPLSPKRCRHIQDTNPALIYHSSITHPSFIQDSSSSTHTCFNLTSNRQHAEVQQHPSSTLSARSANLERGDKLGSLVVDPAVLHRELQTLAR